MTPARNYQRAKRPVEQNLNLPPNLKHVKESYELVLSVFLSISLSIFVCTVHTIKYGNRWRDNLVFFFVIFSSPMSIQRPSSVLQHFQTSFPLKPLGQLNSNFMDARTKVSSNSPGHMTKMAAMPIYGKNPLKIFFSRTRRPITLELGM